MRIIRQGISEKIQDDILMSGGVTGSSQRSRGEALWMEGVLHEASQRVWGVCTKPVNRFSTKLVKKCFLHEASQRKGNFFGTMVVNSVFLHDGC